MYLLTDIVGLKTHIKEILGRCLTILSDLKEQVTNLARFFRNMSLMIGDVTTNQVDRFVDYLNRNTGDGPSIGGFTFTDLERQVPTTPASFRALKTSKCTQLLTYMYLTEDLRLHLNDSVVFQSVSGHRPDVHCRFSRVHIPGPSSMRPVERRSRRHHDCRPIIDDAQVGRPHCFHQ